jgi:hypothetical protein
MHFLPAGAVHFTPGPDKAVSEAIAAFCLAAPVIFWPGSRQVPGRYQEKRKNLPDRPARKSVPAFSCILHKGRKC